MAKYKHNLWQKTNMFEYFVLVHIWGQSKCTSSNYCRVETNMLENFELVNILRKSKYSSSNYVQLKFDKCSHNAFPLTMDLN